MIIEKDFNNKEYRITLDSSMRNHIGLKKGDIYTVELACVNGENILIFRNKNKISSENQEDTLNELNTQNNIDINANHKNQSKKTSDILVYSTEKCGYCNNEIGICRLNVNGKQICNECKNKLIDLTIKKASRRM